MMLFLGAIQFVHLTSGMVIDHSISVTPGVYRLTGQKDFRTPVLVIRGSDLVVDFHGATLMGSPRDTPPDLRSGVAILVDGGHNITLKNGTIRGYKLAILAKSVRGLRIDNCNWSYNWKQHLKSSIAKEDESDWMSFHHNEHDEWIYGSNDGSPGFGNGGAYLTECGGFEVNQCTDVGSQCGLMLNRCVGGEASDNNFSFLSGIGIGLYRSSDNKFERNKLDYCIRGYSHYVYSRGQDSAAILVYEQSNRNTIANNSATHGGDGLFLWAGQSTMDSGKGGCDHNRVSYNDFSHAAANGIEATFSTNQYANNLLMECWHGVWGGFSYESNWVANTIAFCNQGFAIEHGQDNFMVEDRIEDCDEAVSLWANPVAADWAYPKTRNTESRNNTFRDGVIRASSIAAFDTSNTENFRIEGSDLQGNRAIFEHTQEDKLGATIWFANNRVNGDIIDKDGVQLASPSTPIDPPHRNRGAQWINGRGDNMRNNDPTSAEFYSVFDRWHKAIPHLGGADWTMPARLGRSYIFVDEWGPYDFRHPRLILSSQKSLPAGTEYRFQVIGPEGAWKITGRQNVDSLSATKGQVWDELTAKVKSGDEKNFRINLSFVGSKVIDEFGNIVRQPCQFLYTPGA